MIAAVVAIVGLTLVARHLGLEPAVLIIAAGVAWLVFWGLGRGARSGMAHAHGGPIERHERGHEMAARRVGAPIRSIRIGKRDGVVQLADPERMTSRDYIAFMRAGRYAAGTGAGCSEDEANVRAERRRMKSQGMSAAEIRRVVRQADRDARSYGRSVR